MKRTIFALILLLITVQSLAQEPSFKLYLPVITKMSTDNNWRIIQPVASSNIILNPSAETSGNFSVVSGATVTRVTTFQKYGLYSYFIQPVASGDGVQLTTSTATNVEHFVTVRVRKPYSTVQVSINSNVITLRKIEKIDANWDLLGAPITASQANAATSIQILATDGVDFYIDGVQLEPLSYWTTYIDGTQEGCAWQGGAHAAASERSGQSRAGGRSLDFFDEYGFRIYKIVGAGASSHRLSVDSYAILPGGELNSDKVESRDFQINGEFIADTEQELHQKRQELEAAFQTDDNQLARIRFNGAAVQKEIAVRYQSGLEGDLSAFYGDIEVSTNESTKRAIYSEASTIQIVAPNPYWLEVGESAIDLDTNDTGTFKTIAGRLRSTGQWNELGPPNALGTYTSVNAIVEDDVYVYVAGVFTNFDNIAAADNIVRYHKQDGIWSTLAASGANNTIIGLAVGPDGTLYAVGDFTSIGGVAAARIASWDGSAWSALGAGVDVIARTMVFGLDGILYVGGDFLNAGGAGANRVASWDGSAWSALSTGLSGKVLSLAMSLDGTLLYAGGEFVTETRIASWDGSVWATVGTGGADGTVRAVAVAPDGILYAGGGFATIGGTTVSLIASWNGTSWSGLGSGLDNDAYAIRIGPDGVVYVSGAFTIAGGIDLTDRIARWNQYTWAHLDADFPGSPISTGLLASQFSDPVIEQNYDLFVGFNTSGTGTFAGAVVPNNEGSVQAFPKIIYARSGGTTAVIETLRNETTGKELLFDYALLDGETLTIDLDPLEKSITSSFFGSRLDAVLANSDFGTWALQRGNNNITSFINESGTPTLVHYMQWRDAYSGYD